MRTKLKDVIKSLEMTLNSKHRAEKIKTRNQRNRNFEKLKHRKTKPSFTKRIGKRCRLDINPF